MNAVLEPAALRQRASPFDLDDDAGYRAWRADKLAQRAHSAEALIVEVGDPQSLTAAERSAMLQACARWNMVVYRSARGVQDKNTVCAVGRQLGLLRLRRAARICKHAGNGRSLRRLAQSPRPRTGRGTARTLSADGITPD